MDNGKLKLIDFSDGIKSDEIKYNFDILQSQINRERVGVAGPGVSSGMELTPVVNDKEFGVSISESSIVSNDGSEVYIPKQFINIEKPRLSAETEYALANVSNQVTLKHTPYALNRKMPVEFDTSYAPEVSGINVKYQDSTNIDDYIRIRAIAGKTITLSGATRRDVQVTYNYSAKRIDTLYLDKNYSIKVMSSITSTTPSVVIPADYTYLIAFVEIDAYYVDAYNRQYANITVREDLRHIRNLYTDKNGVLYICGTPFDQLQIIHMVEPKDPKEYTMWYDTYTNQLKVWRSCDQLTYMNEFTVTTDFVSNPDVKKDFTTDIYYFVGGKQLTVFVNDVMLDPNQYVEMYKGLPTDEQDMKAKVMTNVFRILSDLKIGDKVTYKITNFDAHYMWVPVNHSSYVNARETKLYGQTAEFENNNYFSTKEALAMGKDANNYPHKYQYFIFDREKDMNMLFTPNKKELTLMINQIPLHIDQYEEITVFDLYGQNLPTDVLSAAQTHFGWSLAEIEKYNAEFENTGIGFKVKDPLDVPYGHEENGTVDLFVEATVQRRVNDGPLKRKLQRTATFVSENHISVTDATKKEYEIPDGFYRYDENQLEIYLNGLRLSKGSGFTEGVDLSDQPHNDPDGNVVADPDRRKGAISRKFGIVVNLSVGDVITYKITTNIYSYDHINDLINDMEYDMLMNTNKVSDIYNKTIVLQQDMETKITDIETQVQTITNVANNLDGKYLEKTDMISDSQLPSHIVTNTVTSLSHISSSITYIAGTYTYDVKAFLREEDFVVVIRRSHLNAVDQLLIRGVDYDIINSHDANGYVTTVFNLTQANTATFDNNDTFLFTGIQFGKAGR